MDSFTIPHKVLCDFLFNNSDATETDLLQHLINVYKIDPKLHSAVKDKLHNGYIKNFRAKLKNAMYQRKAFDKKYKKWLEINNYSEKEIEEAFLQSLRNAGKRKLTNVINQLLRQDDTTKNNENDPCIIPYTADEAVALIEDAKLTKYQYECIRINAAQRNANIYPLYKNLSFAKKECYPESIIITEKGASVDLQSLINHTTKRLIKQPNILLPPISNRIIELELILKWGCDGSSDQSEYKQKFEDSKAIKRTQTGSGLKCAAKFLGPYQIIKALRNERYIVRKVGEHEGPNETSTAVDHMKPWVEDDDYVNDDFDINDCEQSEI
ncbi:hypothetical protein PUN28_017622 [Cardiocondyla obscurior]|uniref:Uncharacterized protein n=1 Tax=Cardiocondyla obscurior TaxID=286306 RepID=A0AAW2EL30_9HYME